MVDGAQLGPQCLDDLVRRNGQRAGGLYILSNIVTLLAPSEIPMDCVVMPGEGRRWAPRNEVQDYN